MKAKAEPLPLETFDDDTDGEVEKTYKAALILFNSLTDDDDAVYNAIRMLEAEDYAVDEIDASFRKVLLEGMMQVDTQDMPRRDWEILDNGIDILLSTDEKKGALEAGMQNLHVSQQQGLNTCH